MYALETFQLQSTAILTPSNESKLNQYLYKSNTGKYPDVLPYTHASLDTLWSSAFLLR